ncbi:MAG TPA: tyrosine-type recombinase/integrase [Terriglobales bacterium]|nr:tyrosine-type recombinase/integrase [Terriglobales bacterium]
MKQIFETQIDLLATTLQPNSLLSYRRAVKSFLRYLRANHPRVSSLAGLRRDPHILGWLHHLCDQDPPSSKGTRLLYLLCFRRLLNDLADGGDYIIQEGLIRREDFPRLDQYLPKPLSLDDDQRLQNQLRTNDDLFSNALLLLRGTGMRIGELLNLPTDSLRHLGDRDWALHVPLGKLHTDRWVPVDDDVRRVHARLVALRQHSGGAAHSNLLLPLPAKPGTRYIALLRAVRTAARKAGCSVRVKPHQLRHTYATSMLRAGVSLPALMHLLGHKTLDMTLRYVQVTQNDLQQQYHLARQNMPSAHSMPQLPTTHPLNGMVPGIPAITQSLAPIRHLLEMYRRQLPDGQIRRKLERWANRLAKIAAEANALNDAGD